MTVLRENFRPVADVIPVVRRDFGPADKTLTDPTNPLALTDGEWMTLDSTGKLIRATTIGNVGEAGAAKLTWPLWAEQGRYDIQAMAEKKTPILWLHSWEFETRIFDAAAVVGNGAAIASVLQPLKIATITIGGRNYTGLVGHGGSGDTDRVVAYVTRLPTNNGGWLRIRGGNNY